MFSYIFVSQNTNEIISKKMSIHSKTIYGIDNVFTINIDARQYKYFQLITIASSIPTGWTHIETTDGVDLLNIERQSIPLDLAEYNRRAIQFTVRAGAQVVSSSKLIVLYTLFGSVIET